MATNYDITIPQGDSINLRIQARDVNSNIINLSGFDTRGFVRRSYCSTGIVLDLSPSIDSGNLASGFIDIDLSGGQTQGLPPIRAVYDVEVFRDDFVLKVLTGRVLITPDVTY